MTDYLAGGAEAFAPQGSGIITGAWAGCPCLKETLKRKR